MLKVDLTVPVSRARILRVVLCAALVVPVVGCGGSGSSDPATSAPPASLSDSATRAVALAAITTPVGTISSSAAFASELVAAANGRWYTALTTVKTVRATYPLLLGPEQFGATKAVPADPYYYSTLIAGGAQGRSSVVDCGPPAASYAMHPIPALESLSAAGQLPTLTATAFVDDSLGAIQANAIATAAIATTAYKDSVGDYSRQVLRQCQRTTVSQAGAVDFVVDGQIRAQIVALPASNQMVIENIVSGLVTTTGGVNSTVAGTYYGNFTDGFPTTLIHDDIEITISGLNAPLTAADPMVHSAVLLVPTPTTTSTTTDHLKVVYTGWGVDLPTGTGTTGFVTVSDRSNNAATITATATGFRVVIGLGGVSQTFDVPR